MHELPKLFTGEMTIDKDGGNRQVVSSHYNLLVRQQPTTRKH